MASRHRSRSSSCKSLLIKAPLNIRFLITHNSDIDNCLYPKSKYRPEMSELVF